jgi:hypothetical protein
MGLLALFFACTFAGPYLGRKLKARVATNGVVFKSQTLAICCLDTLVCGRCYFELNMYFLTYLRLVTIKSISFNLVVLKHLMQVLMNLW